MLFSLGVKHTICSPYTISRKIFHFRNNLILKVYFWRNMIVEIFLKLMIWNFIAFLIFAIILAIFLYRIIGKMSEKVFSIFIAILTWSCPYVAFFVPISFDSTIVTCNHHIMSYVKFTFLIKQWFLYIFLDDKCSVCSIGIMLFGP